MSSLNEDDPRQLRDDTARLRARLDAVPDGREARTPRVVGRVVTGGDPGQFITVTPVRVSGADAAGSTAVFADGAGTFPAALLGTSPALAGDLLVCSRVNYRWVAQKPKPGNCRNVLSFVARGCLVNTGLAGAAAVVKRGSDVVASWTTGPAGTNPAGTVSLPPGTYGISASKARYKTKTGALTVNNACTPTGGILQLVPADGFRCRPLCPDPVPNVLRLTDSQGTHLLTYTADRGSWWTYYYVDAENVASVGVPGRCDTVGCAPTGAVRVDVNLGPSAFTAGAWGLNYSAQGIPFQCGAGTAYATDEAATCQPWWVAFGGATTSDGCAVPTDLSFSLPGNWYFSNSFGLPGLMEPIPALVSGAATVTE